MRQNFFWALVSSVVNGATNWSMFIVLAKAGTPEMLGLYALGLAVVTPIGLLTDLNLRATLGTDVQGQFPFRDYLGLRLYTCVVLGLAVLAVVFCGGYSREAGLVIMAVSLSKALESIIDIYYGLFQQQQRMGLVARSLLLRGPFSVFSVAVIVHSTGSVLAGVLALSLSRAMVLIAHDIPTAGRSEVGLRVVLGEHWRDPCRLAWMTLPLGIVTMLIALNASIPQLFLDHHWGARDLGFFGALVAMAGAGAVVAAAAGQSVSPNLALAYAVGEHRRFWQLLFALLGGGVLLGAVGVCAVLLVGHSILSWVYSHSYAAYSPVLAWLVAALTIDHLTSFLGWGMLATRRYRLYPIPFILTSLVVTVASTFLVPRFGLEGAAWAMCITNVVGFSVLLGLLSWSLHVAIRGSADINPSAVRRTSLSAAETSREGSPYHER